MENNKEMSSISVQLYKRLIAPISAVVCAKGENCDNGSVKYPTMWHFPFRICEISSFGCNICCSSLGCGEYNCGIQTSPSDELDVLVVGISKNWGLSSKWYFSTMRCPTGANGSFFSI